MMASVEHAAALLLLARELSQQARHWVSCSVPLRMHAERRSVCHDKSSSGVYLIATRTGARASSVYAYAVSMVAAIAGLLFGFDIAVINGAIVFLREQFSLSDFQTEVAAGSLLLGCAAGAACGGYLSDRFGRRRILVYAAILFAVSSIGAAFPNRLSEFVIARLLAGVATGVASLLAPLYIAENAPPHIRGRLVTFNQMAIVSGILIAYLVNWLLSGLGPNSWRWMFASAALPAIAFWIALMFVPESPRWLIRQARYGEALRILDRLGGPVQAKLEFEEIREAVLEEESSVRQLLEPAFRLPLIIAVALAILQQVTGVNTVLYYGALIFREQVGEKSASAAIFANVIVGAVNFLATIVAIWIIDRVGRKPLLLASSAGMAASLVTLGLAFRSAHPPGILVLAVMLCYVSSFGIGLGPGVWVLMSELFPTRVRGRAMAVATVSLWLACLLLSSTFLSLVSGIGASGTFWLYAGMCVITFLFVWRVTPETKGKTLEQIERMWKLRRAPQ
jgi:sugar porter (SP) family MFS transporter